MSDQDKGMLVEWDEITPADLMALRDLNPRETRRREKFVREVHDGTLIEGTEKREVFSFNEPSIGTWVFDVRGIKDGILAGRIQRVMFRLEKIPEHFFRHVLENNGVEPDKVARVKGPDLDRAGIMVAWGQGGNTTLIDGNHRLCARYILGKTDFRFFLVRLQDCARHMCRPGDEEKLFASPERPGYEVLHSEVTTEE